MTIREIRTFNSKIRKLERLSEQYLDSKIKIEIENKKLKQKLKNTRKALDKAKWWLNEIVENHRYTPISTAEMALKEITALEQKDVK